MGRITPECEARIKEAGDIIDTLGRYITLRRAGSAWKSCCPFHQEKTPSFHINPARQSFHCFGCGVGGDAIKFLMLFENLSYPDALRRLADMNGVPIIEQEESPELSRRRRMRGLVIEVNRLAMEFFHLKLCRAPEASHVRDYLKKRGINIAMARAWKLGWAPHQFQAFAQLARKSNINEEQLTEANLLGRGQRGLYPVFRDRLMFPIMNIRGEVLGFSGRVMDDSQDPRKYVNTSDTMAFHKSEILFGLHKATAAIGKQDMTVVLCEGQIDVIACHEKAEIRNAIAGLGTAFTDEHAKMLRKYAKRAVLCYDGDSAGIKASERAFRKLASVGIEVQLAVLPKGEDPDSLIEGHGAAALQEIIKNARTYLEMRCTQELKLIGNDGAKRANLINAMANLTAEIADANRRDIALVELATRLHTGLDMFRELVADEINQNKRAAEKSQQNARKFEQRNNANSSSSYNDYPEYNEDEGFDESYSSDIKSDRPNALPIRADKIHPAIAGLLSLAQHSDKGQDLLLERIEDLQAAIKGLPGGAILQCYFEVLPKRNDEASWTRFTARLSPSQNAAVVKIEQLPSNLDKIEHFIDQACERAARIALQQEIDILRSRIYNPELSEKEKLDTLQQISEFQRMLN